MSVISESRINIIPFGFPIVIVCLVSPLFKFWPRAGYSLFKKAGMLFTVSLLLEYRNLFLFKGTGPLLIPIGPWFQFQYIIFLLGKSLRKAADKCRNFCASLEYVLPVLSKI
jgi:hypothetical protein